MVEQAKLETFLSALTAYNKTGVFNPWLQNCEKSDGIESKNVRLENLRNVIISCSILQEVDLWIGRDLGWRGGRRTGVPFIDDTTLSSYGKSISNFALKKATTDKPLRERTATEIDIARSRISRKLFFWNVFPYHPHEVGNSFSNRMHTPNERRAGEEILLLVLELIPFRKIIAVGNDAAKMVEKIGIDCGCVRHPSFGGQKHFHNQVNKYYGVNDECTRQNDLFNDGVKLCE